MQFESGFLTFMVTPTTLNSYATLGIPYFMAYHIDIDRDLGTVRFQQGIHHPPSFNLDFLFTYSHFTLEFYAGCGCSASETLPSVATTNAEVILTPVTSSAFKRGPSTCTIYFVSTHSKLTCFSQFCSTCCILLVGIVDFLS